jgi:hypothetical protein
VQPARSHESPFTTSPKIPVHLGRHFPFKPVLTSIHSTAHFHGVPLLLDTVHRRPQRPNERLYSLHHHVLISIRTIILSTHRSSRLGCRLAHPGDPENHIPMIHLPLTRTSLYLLYIFQGFIFIASISFLFDSLGNI